MKTNRYFNKKRGLLIPEDKNKRKNSNYERGLENDDFFIDMSPIPCIMGQRLILNEKYIK